MLTCKDCIHYKICKYYDNHLTEEDIKAGQDMKDLCQHFKDRSEFIEKPCEVGDKVFTIDDSRINEYVVEGICQYKRENKLKLALLVRIYNGIEYLTASEIRLSGHTAILGKHFYSTQIGQSVFLTREEAKKALKERESNV